MKFTFYNLNNRFQLLLLLLLTCSQRTLGENNQKEADEKIDHFPKSPRHRFQPSHEEPSFMSKIASWIFPFGNSDERPVDNVPAATHQRYAPKYLPPAKEHPQRNCNPCNSEPWIPVAGRHGHNTVIGFIQPPNNGYGVPQAPPITNYGSPMPHYGAPQPPLQRHPQYGVPKDQYGFDTNLKPNYKIPTHFLPPPPNKHNSHKYRGLPHKPPKQRPKYNPGKHIPKLKHPPHGPPIPLHYNNEKPDQTLAFAFTPPSLNAEIVNYNLAPLGFDYVPPPIPNHYQSLTTPINNNYVNVEQNILGNTGINPQISFGDPNALATNLPIPFPQINYAPIPPLYNSQPFHQVHQQNEQSVQVIPSIRVADYVATVEHPINVIQSPLVEVIATENNQNETPERNYGTPPAPTSSLNTNPIVVEDNHPAATINNSSYQLPDEQPKINEFNHHNALTEPQINQHNFNTQNGLSSSGIGFSSSGGYGQQILEPNPTLNTVINTTPPPLELSTSAVLNQNILPPPQPIKPVPSFNFGLSTQRPVSLDVLSTILANKGLNINLSSLSNLPNFPRFPIPVTSPSTFTKSFENQINTTNLFQQLHQNGFVQNILNNANLSHPTMNWGNWTPTYGTLSTSMVPPPLGLPLWGNQYITQPPATTKKPKQVQIIIPYSSTKEIPGKWQQPQVSSLPLHTLPPPAGHQSVWNQYTSDYHQEGSDKVTAKVPPNKPYTIVTNIRDLLLQEERERENLRNNKPIDILRLQKNIDNWTHQEYANTISDIQKQSTIGKLVPSKNIPAEYLTTQPYSVTPFESTTKRYEFYDHEPAGSDTKEHKKESNFIIIETTPAGEQLTTTPLVKSTKSNNSSTVAARVTMAMPTTKPHWEKLQVSISPLTKEKIYVVTPQPWRFTPKEINDKLFPSTEASNLKLENSKFTVVIQPEGYNGTRKFAKEKEGLHIVYSEWPHLSE